MNQCLPLVPGIMANCHVGPVRNFLQANLARDPGSFLPSSGCIAGIIGGVGRDSKFPALCRGFD